MLPKWIQDSEKPIIVHQRESGKMLNKEPVKIRSRVKDKALFVGGEVQIQLMQETLNREGVGKTRMFDANAKRGTSKQGFSEAEHEAATIAHSIEK